MKILYFSDVHLETGPFEPDPKALDEADVVVAAGDIGVGTQGVEWLQSLPKPVVYVPGNHEFWSEERTDYVEILNRIRSAAAGSNVHVLDRGKLVIGNVRFLGATLWTDYAAWNMDYVESTLGRMRDFEFIGARSWYTAKNLRKQRRLLRAQRARHFEESGAFSPVIAYELHRKAVAWLRREFARPWVGETVIVTHHAPTTQSLIRAGIESWAVRRGGMLRNDENLNPVYRAAYASDVEPLLGNPGRIATWIHGHLHSRLDFAFKGARICCNARGRHMPALTEKTRENYRWLGINISDAKMAEDQADFEQHPWRGANADFVPDAIVDLADGVMPALMRDVLPEIESMRHDLKEALMFVSQMGAKQAAIRMALKEVFNTRVNRMLTSASDLLNDVHENLTERVHGAGRDGLGGLAREFCGPHPYQNLTLTLRKGASMRQRAELVLSDYDTLITSIARLPEYLQRKREEMLEVIASVTYALAEAGIGADVASPAIDGPLRRVPYEVATVRVHSGAIDRDAVFRVVDHAANKGSIPRRWLFELEMPAAAPDSTRELKVK